MQSLNIVESKELCELFTYIGTDLRDGDIPHRTKITSLIFEGFQWEHKKLVDEIQACLRSFLPYYFYNQPSQNSLGRVSFTSDLWSDPNLTSYMAITAHYCIKDENGNLVVRSRLVAFRHVTGSHSGTNLAQHFMGVIQELGVLHKVLYTSSDVLSPRFDNSTTAWIDYSRQCVQLQHNDGSAGSSFMSCRSPI